MVESKNRPKRVLWAIHCGDFPSFRQLFLRPAAAVEESSERLVTFGGGSARKRGNVVGTTSFPPEMTVNAG
jgi:hypothetical protein